MGRDKDVLARIRMCAGVTAVSDPCARAVEGYIGPRDVAERVQYRDWHHGGLGI